MLVVIPSKIIKNIRDLLPCMNPPRVIIFDVDGVLLDSEGGIRGFREMLDHPDLKWNPELKGEITPMMLIRLLEGCDHPNTLVNLWRLYTRLGTYMRSHRSRSRLIKIGLKTGRSYEFQYSDFFPGIVDMLRDLAARGYYLGICSNAESPRLVTWIERKNIGDVLKCWVTRDDKKVYGLKPSGKPILGVIERIQTIYGLPAIEPSSVVYIGDNVTDVLAGKNAGVKTIAVLSGHGYQEELVDVQPNLVLDVATELPSHLDELFTG
nr:HAD family hydrolase [Candidatus Sigynarchaeota archaeon]